MKDDSSKASPFRLSASQERVVTHRGSDLQVIACAGSGKTEAMARRVASLLMEGVPPEAIVAFTFTERAAFELKERIVRRVEERLGSESLDRLGPLFVGTIHAYCFRLLQDYVPRYGNYDVLDDHRHAGFLSRQHRFLKLGKLGRRHWAPVRDFIRTADIVSNELIDPAVLEGTPFGECYNEYRDALDRFHFLTYAQLITAALEALEDMAIRERVRRPLQHLLVDEYQDINPSQERLIELLAQPPVALCVVGDDDQSIYQWRGADVQNILEFTWRRPTATTVSLTTNRRSRPAILEAANAFATSIPSRLPKEMDSARPSAEPEIACWSAATEEEEAAEIVRAIDDLHKRGFRYRDIAVLFRSVRTSAPPLIAALEEAGIPFTCGGRTGLFQHPEVALFGELFAWIADFDWRDHRWGERRKADFDRVIAGLEGNFGPHPGLRRYLEDWKSFQLRGIRPVSLVGDFYKLLHRLGADTIDVDTPEGAARFGAFARFSSVLADFEHVHRRGRLEEGEESPRFKAGKDRGVWYFRSLASYLLHYAQDAYEDFEGEPVEDLDAVDVLTIHQAKGLEWPVVFVPALVDGRFPSRRAGQAQEWLLPETAFPPAKQARYEGSEAEERRLFYVAMTRARDCLYLSWFQRRKNAFRPSLFLVEVAGEPPEPLPSLPCPPPPDQRGAAEVSPHVVSFSELALFEECGFRYRLGIVFGYQQELAVELGYGKAVHHVLRQLAERVRAGEEVPEGSTLDALVDQELYLPFADPRAFVSMRRSAGRLAQRYLERWSADLDRIWALERPFEIHLAAGRLTGRADVILDREAGEMGALAIVDYKVAHDAERDERYRQQLAVYAAAARGEGLRVDAAYLHDLRRSARDAVDIGQEATGAAIAGVAASLESIRRAHYPAHPTLEACRACDFRALCRHRHAEAPVL